MRILLDAHHIGSDQTGKTYARAMLHLLGGCRSTGARAILPSTGPVRVRQVAHNGSMRLGALSLLGRAEAVHLVQSMFYRVPSADRPTVFTIHDASYER